MKISYNWLKEYVSKLPKPEKLADLLTMHSFEVKEIQKTGKDWILDIDVLSNRAHDCLSHIGVVRECAALLGFKFQVSGFRLNEDKKLQAKDFISVEIKDVELCPRYCARIITDIKIGSSPKWLKEKLESIGQQPINNVVDAANFVMFETGQPLHAFDADKLNGKKIIVRRAKKGEEIITIDGEKYELNNDILVIADLDEPLAIAGIKGGKKAGINKNTKTIILESANFNLNNIHASSRKLGLQTDASLRFEHGLDPNLALEAIDRVAGLICKVAGGKIARGAVDIYPRKLKPRKISLKIAKVNSLLGVEIPEKEIIRILNLLGLKTKKIGIQLLVEIPTRRLDIELPEDLVEEIGRIYGYEKIPSKPPIGILVSPKVDDLLRLRNKVKDILESLGLVEVYNYSFIGEGDLEKIKASPNDYIELENPLSADLKYLRQDLIISLLRNVKDNFRYFNEIRLFELGKIYLAKPKVGEKLMLGGVLGKKEKGSNLFYEAKGIVDGLLNKLGIAGQWYDDFQQTPEYGEKKIWHPKISAEIKLDNQEIGFLGEINPEILSKFGIKGQVAAFNIDFELLIKLVSEELIYQPPSKYPAAVRDIAVLVNPEDRVTHVLNVINSAGGELVSDVDLFDMYEGEGIPEGKKNLAFHIVYQSNSRTATDAEVNVIHNSIVKALERKGWEVRK